MYFIVCLLVSTPYVYCRYGSTSFAFWQDLMCCNAMKQHILKYMKKCDEYYATLSVPASAQDMYQNGPIFNVCVFGSSQGLLVFFTYILIRYQILLLSHERVKEKGSDNTSYFPSNSVETEQRYRVHICGYEVMPLLYKKSVDVMHMLNSELYPHDSIQFLLQDMFTSSSSDISKMDMMVLTSLCWDKSTRRAVAKKVSRYHSINYHIYIHIISIVYYTIL